MPTMIDGPSTGRFAPLRMTVTEGFAAVPTQGVSEQMAAAAAHAPSGHCVCWGIPFHIRKLAVVRDRPVRVKFAPVRSQWLVFLHTSDLRPPEVDENGFPAGKSGTGRLGEHAADYVVLYADGTEERLRIRRRYQLGAVQRGWGENCFEAVAHRRPHPVRPHHEQLTANWGRSQMRASADDRGEWVNWLWAWQNPRPRKAIVGLRLEPVSGTVILSGLSAGRASSNPLRWEPRRKAVLRLPKGETFDPTLDERGLLRQIQLDMGQVISAVKRPIYPNESWNRSYNNQLPELAAREVIVEYTAHSDACFHLARRAGATFPSYKLVAVSKLKPGHSTGAVAPVSPATQRITIRAIEKAGGKEVAVKLHVHGEAGEYLAPVDRHRIPNPAWFEDYSADFAHAGRHYCTYIAGRTELDLPLGRVFLEVSKGFEIAPLRKAFAITPRTTEIVVEIEKVLPWRERGWVSADTHVHFLSPQTGLLEGAGEGVNVVNLLASQWGELMTNVGDFDGKTTWGSRETGGDGEYLLRVGTENRQHVLGHISLLGYEGDIIAPMTTGGPDESALGDAIGALLTEWAMQCKKQNGVVVIPHFPNPRAEHAATLATGAADAVEMTSWGDLYSGINPYSLVDWYRYLNCGYLVAAVGGTDKMTANTAVGTVRTYARIEPGQEFTYEAWKQAIRKARTFVTYGPLVEFSVEGNGPGSRIELGPGGGTVAVTWKAASVTVPMSRAELVVNGEIRESQTIRPNSDEGHWSAKLDRSSWLALLVRGHYHDKPEIVAAHSSPVMIDVGGSPFLAAGDALTILEQIEGALAYLDTTGTRAQDAAYKRMRLMLTSAHRRLHNRLHQAGQFHQHTPVDDHPQHHG